MARPPVAPEAQVFIAIQRAADQLDQDFARLLRPYGLSPAQYNVLRILRGAGPDGLPSGEVAARMIAKDPDMTRLLDRMEKQGWIERARSEHDRRVVLAYATKTGLALAGRLDEPVAARHAATLGRLGRKRLLGLVRELKAAAESFSAAEHLDRCYDDNR